MGTALDVTATTITYQYYNSNNRVNSYGHCTRCNCYYYYIFNSIIIIRGSTAMGTALDVTATTITYLTVL